MLDNEFREIYHNAKRGDKDAQYAIGMHWLASKNSRGYDPVSYTHLTLPTICSV